MANNFTVVVILPNARRMSMKVNPNTIILQILEDVCKKQELVPIEWDLTHHNKVVDLGNSIRFSGIPNNATMEMIKSTKTRKESTINLGIQLESGKRLQHSFLPHQTLWEVLEYWNIQGENVYPEKDNELHTEAVCIYMRQEVLGEEQLKNKTLRGLGLTQGSAMIRLLHRSANQLKHQANVSGPLSRTVVPVESNDKVVPDNKSHLPSNSKGSEVVEKQPEFLSNCAEQQSEPEPMEISPPVSERDHQSQKPTDLLSDNSNKARKSLGDKQVDKILTMGTSESQQPLPPAITNAERYSKQGQFHLLGARDAILFHGDDVAVSTSQERLQDDFFEVTISDVRKMYKDLRERRTELEETPFQTRSAREFEKDAAMLKNLKDHPNTVVRIRFGNRYVLQGTFRTADTIGTVENWLKEFLINTELNFYLFDTPPKRILSKETRLVEEGMVGMAVIYFGSEDPSASTDQCVLKPEVYEKVSDPVAVFEFIRTKLRKDKLSSDSDTTTSNDQQSALGECQVPASQQGSSTSTANGTSGSSGSGGSGTVSTARRQPAQQPRNVTGGSDTGNVPKWFKLTK